MSGIIFITSNANAMRISFVMNYIALVGSRRNNSWWIQISHCFDPIDVDRLFVTLCVILTLPRLKRIIVKHIY